MPTRQTRKVPSPTTLTTSPRVDSPSRSHSNSATSRILGLGPTSSPSSPGSPSANTKTTATALKSGHRIGHDSTTAFSEACIETATLRRLSRVLVMSDRTDAPPATGHGNAPNHRPGNARFAAIQSTWCRRERRSTRSCISLVLTFNMIESKLLPNRFLKSDNHMTNVTLSSRSPFFADP